MPCWFLHLLGLDAAFSIADCAFQLNYFKHCVLRDGFRFLTQYSCAHVYAEKKRVIVIPPVHTGCEVIPLRPNFKLRDGGQNLKSSLCLKMHSRVQPKITWGCLSFLHRMRAVDFPPFTYIGITLGRDLFMTSLHGRNNYSHHLCF